MVYVVYKYNFILSFFNTVLSTYTGIITTNPSGTLYNIYIYLAIVLMIILMIVLIGLLYMKKKPIKLYIVNIVAYIIVTILIAYSYNVVGQMELKIVDPKIIRNTRDFMFIGFLIQVIQIVLFTIRTIGFDVKKFDFKNDLKEFDIVEEDNEEFEFDIKIDVNKAHRGLNKGKRYLGYYYKENRYVFFVVSSICVVILSLIIYLSMGVYNKKYTQTEHFRTSEFMLAINNTYVTSKDYRGNVILENKALVVLEMDIKSNSLNGTKLNLSRTELVVNDNKYYHNNLYRDKLIDIGNVYQDEIITNTFSKYLLVYEIPKEFVGKKMEFRYIDKSNDVTKLSAKTITIKLNARDLDKNKKTIEYDIKEEIDFKNSILGDTKIMLNNLEIDKSFVQQYYFCASDCYDSIERIKPSIVNNYDKVLLKLIGKISWDDEIATPKTTNVFKLLSLFGSFEYTINGETKKDPTILKQVVPNKEHAADVYYLEVIDEMLNAEKIDLILKVRDYTYIYHLK